MRAELPRHRGRDVLIKSMHTDQFNHAPAELLLFTGIAPRQGGPRWARG
jgi:hypothetical protein